MKASCKISLCISVLAFLVPLSLVSTSSSAIIGKVTSIEGRYMELDIGADKGIKVGDIGRVYYTVKIEGKEKPIYTAKFKVTHISQRSCMAQIEDKTGEVRIRLFAEILPRVAELDVNSVPSGAMVYVNGKSVGAAPYEGKNFSQGSYKVRVEKEGYEVWEKEITVEAGKRKEVLAELALLKIGELEVKSEPTGAKAYFNGKEIGDTPIKVSGIAPGRYELRIIKEGYAPHEEQVRIAGGKSETVKVSLRKSVGNLMIRTEPGGATVYVDGKSVGVSPHEGKDLSPGTHKVRVVKEGHEPWEKEVMVKANEQVQVTASLKRISGAVVIRTDPAGANIDIDGNRVGVSPYEGENLSPGTHKVRVEKEGYEVWEGQVVVEAGRVKETFAKLELKVGELEVRSEPTGVKVLLDGKEVGETPLVLRGTSPGRHRIRIAKEGYDTHEESVDVKVKERTKVDVSLRRLVGGLLTKTDPTGANVYLDAKLVGVSPHESKGLIPGAHGVRVEKDGYEVLEKEVVVKASERAEVSVNLKRVIGSLLIQTEPTGADVYIDGKSLGVSPHEAKELSPGSHKVRIVKEGYGVLEKEVMVEAGKKGEIRSQLVKLEVPKKSEPPPVSPPKTGLLKPERPSQEKLERPIWNIDDSWRYANQGGKDWEVKVVRIENDLVIVKNSSDGSLVGIDKKSLEEKVYVMSKGRKTKEAEMGDFSFAFPLEVGKRWSKMVTATSTKTHMPGNFLNEYRVVAYEDVAVPAGTFMAYKIEFNQTHLSGYFVTTGKKKAYIWYSPEIKREVKVVYEGLEWGAAVSFELASCRLN